MEIEYVIKSCYHSCPLFSNNMDGMYCDHPFFKDKGAWSNMIITQENSRDGNIPEECPLKNGYLTITTEYKLEIK